MRLFLEKDAKLNKYLYDFIFETDLAAESDNWFYNTKVYDIIPITIDELRTQTIDQFDVCIGSIEFVKVSMGSTPLPPPLNIPECLRTKRCLSRYVSDNVTKGSLSYPIFIKPSADLKLFTGFVAKSEKDLGFYPQIKEDTLLFTSDVLDNILTEYRCFIYKNTLVDIRQYSGDFTRMLQSGHFSFINSWIKDFEKNAPVAYTMDIAVLDTHPYTDIAIIELNDYFSVCTYGFGGKTHLRMLVDRYREMKNLLRK
jgi:hypothetical protein